MMRVVDWAVAAMNTHRGVAAVAEHGLVFLRHVSTPEPNRVRRQVMGVFVVIWGWVVGAGAWCSTHDAGVVAGVIVLGRQLGRLPVACPLLVACGRQCSHPRVCGGWVVVWGRSR